MTLGKCLKVEYSFSLIHNHRKSYDAFTFSLKLIVAPSYKVKENLLFWKTITYAFRFLKVPWLLLLWTFL